MEQYFNDILDKDEKIIKVFKPNKTKLYFSVFLTAFLILGWAVIPASIGMIFGEGVTNLYLALGLLAFGTVVVTLLIWGVTALYYSKLYYAYSNKRVIIRTGIFGVDYKSLDMSMIGAVNVYVSLLDKILRKNTGTITFGSMASPMVTASGTAASFRFASIVTPYDTYKEVKNVIDEYKESKNHKI